MTARGPPRLDRLMLGAAAAGAPPLPSPGGGVALSSSSSAPAPSAVTAAACPLRRPLCGRGPDTEGDCGWRCTRRARHDVPETAAARPSEARTAKKWDQPLGPSPETGRCAWPPAQPPPGPAHPPACRAAARGCMRPKRRTPPAAPTAAAPPLPGDGAAARRARGRGRRGGGAGAPAGARRLTAGHRGSWPTQDFGRPCTREADRPRLGAQKKQKQRKGQAGGAHNLTSAWICRAACPAAPRTAPTAPPG
jgi:hypothetical protein